MSKSNTAKNALTHGLYATNVVLPWENQQDFDDLLRGIQDEYCPDGVSEDEAVIDLAILHWKKRRLEAGLQQALEQLNSGKAPNISDPAGDIARMVAKSQLEAAQRAGENLGKQAEEVCKADITNAGGQLYEFEKLTSSLKEFSLGFKDLVSSLRDAEDQRLNQIAQAFFPDILQKGLKIEAEIDRRIEKVLKRLVMAKEYKRHYVAKSANANQIEATKLRQISPQPGGPDSNGPMG